MTSEAPLSAHFARLRQGHVVPWRSRWWRVFWETPLSAGDIETAAAPHLLKQVWEGNQVNYVMMVRVVAAKVVEDAGDMPTRHLLSCLRWLVRLVPYGYEVGAGDAMWWDTRPFDKMLGELATLHSAASDVPPHLAPDLLKALLALLHRPGFTSDSDAGAMWEPGLGQPQTRPYTDPNVVVDANRLDVLRAVMVVVAEGMTRDPHSLVVQGSRCLSWLVSEAPRVALLTSVCSMLNSWCRATDNTHGKLEYPASASLTETRRHFVTVCSQLVVLMVSYPVPPSGPRNMVRHYFSRLGEDDLDFIFTAVISQGSSSMLTVETVSLVWELVQCNKRAVPLIANKYGAELVVSLIGHLRKTGPSFQVSAQFLWYLSSRADLLQTLFTPMGRVYDELPASVKVSPAPTTTRDYAVMSLCPVVSKASDPMLASALYNFIVATSSAPVPAPQDPTRRLANTNIDGGLSYASCAAITTLIKSLASYDSFQHRGRHSRALALVVRALVTAVCHHPAASRMVSLSLWRNESVYRQLAKVLFSVKTAPPPPNEDDDGDIELCGFSAAHREKLPQGASISRAWGATTDVHILLNYIMPLYKRTVDADDSPVTDAGLDSYHVACLFEKIDFEPLYRSHMLRWDQYPSATVALIRSKWTPARLGDYLALIYHQIVTGADECRRLSGGNSLMKGLNDSLAHMSKFTSSWRGLWGAKEEPSSPEVSSSVVEYVERSVWDHGPWHHLKISVYPFPDTQGLDHLARRLSGMWSNSTDTVSDVEPPSPPQRPHYSPRNSMASLHSLNTLNRSRSSITHAS
ncbi:hypothetical protein DIURU_002397 [Diutina rugosa]|uniref:Armadillo-like helical domain-containing protein n=1 Tax=Diutina rugosa TaxID=5481 RepID=A0A642UQD1_DIURU|nr:uncharacterized protein DIURU_002397 [Diutina rugosa]KAA8903511.1 hypothetical protein DIURU_002397 [Diutina rugosa]